MAVTATRPLAPVEHASGRIIRKRRRKVWRFLWTEGPGATFRKARSKLAEKRFTGDLHVVALTGRLEESGTPIAGVACRVPPAAEYLVVHETLVQTLAEPLSPEELAGFGDRLEAALPDLGRLGSQSFLYSGESPPDELVAAVGRALQGDRLAGETAADVVGIPSEGRAPPDPSQRIGPSPAGTGLPVALLGAGDYARTQIVPALAGAEVERVSLADREPQIAALAAESAGFSLATTDARLAIDALPRPGAVFVATYHDSHAELAAAALAAGHGVFVEKPPVVTEDDLALLVSTLATTSGALEVGFNRRYNGLVREAKEALAGEEGPVTVVCVVREVALEPTHWYLWPNQGTRVTGNLCHWIDLGVFLMESRPLPETVVVSPAVTERREHTDEERAVTVTFDDGSVLTIVATGRGDDIRGVQELIQARRGGVTVTIDDLWRLSVLRAGRERRKRTRWRDKGHGAMLRAALRRFESGAAGGYPMRDLVVVSAIQIAASRLTREGETACRVDDAARRWLEEGWPERAVAHSSRQAFVA